MMEGTPGFPALPFSKRWRQPGVHVRFGRPFHYRPELKRAGRDLLSKMLDEAMYRLAAIIPENRRGVYSDLSRATQDTLEIL
jgi:1-acyl-sn-glycerol-3-phosphate acyltransferase